MKNILFINIFFLSLFVNVKGQVLDLGNLKVTYKLSYINDTSNVLKVSNDLMLLIVGKNISTFYSYKQFIADSTLNSDIEKGESQTNILANLKKYKGSKNSYLIFKDYQNHKIITYDKIFSNQFQYEEKFENPIWEITTEKTKILSYTCQKATTSFYGRNYEAWFTTDIPISNGPWKFSGLPGLILSVYDTRKHYNFECIGIELLKPSKIIEFPKGKFDLVSKQEFQKMYKRFRADPIGCLQASTGSEIQMLNGNKSDAIKPYNPIEL